MVNANAVLRNIAREVTHDAVRKSLASSWGKKITPDIWFKRTFNRQELEHAGISTDTRYADLSGRLILWVTPLGSNQYRVRVRFRG